MKIKILFILALFIAVSCNNDTCNEVVGETFPEIDYANTVNNQNGNVVITLSLTTNDKLPISYFDEVYIIKSENDPAGNAWQNSFEAFDSVKFSKTQAFLYLKNQFIQDNFNKLNFSLHLNFPDRVNFIECNHPGSTDVYTLDISFDITNNDNVNYDIENFSWQETLNKGGY